MFKQGKQKLLVQNLESVNAILNIVITLFIKLPLPGDSEGTLQSMSQVMFK